MNKRTIIVRNVGDHTIGLRDTQGRAYGLEKGNQVRVSKETLMDILDFPGSKKIFKEEGLAKVENISVSELMDMGLTEDEAKSFRVEKDAIEIEPEVIEDDEDEENDDEVVITPKAPEAPKVKTATVKKASTAKSTTAKKKTSAKTK